MNNKREVRNTVRRTAIFSIALLIYGCAVTDREFTGPNYPIYFAYTSSIVEDGDFNVFNNVDGSPNYVYGSPVTPAYNLPDFHDYGGVVFWVPMYLYAKMLSVFSGYPADVLARAVMSLSTVFFGIISLFLITVLIHKKEPPGGKPLTAAAAVFFGTPYFYYVFFRTGNVNVVLSLFTLASVWFCFSAEVRKRKEWLLFGILSSAGIAARTDFSLFTAFVLLYMILLTLMRRVRFSNVLAFAAGLLPLILLRGINSQLKFGVFRLEEFFYLNSFMDFNRSYNFDGLFSSFRGLFYTSPLLLICLAGIIPVLSGIRADMTSGKLKSRDLFLLAAFVFLLLKITLIGRIFSPAGDELTARLFFAEIPLFAILFYRLTRIRGRVFKAVLASAAVTSVFWNLIIVSEYIGRLEWLYASGIPPLMARVGALRHYLFSAASDFNSFRIKIIVILPIITAWLLFRAAGKIRPARGNTGSADARTGKVFRASAVYVFAAYLLMTLLNLRNNAPNVREMAAEGLFDDASIEVVRPLEISDYEKEEHQWSLVMLQGYYALRGDETLAGRVKEKREEIFGDRVRGRLLLRLPLISRRNTPVWIEDIDHRYATAIETFDGLISKDPEDYESLTGKGNVYEALERYDEAVISYQRALEVNPKLHLLREWIAEIRPE